MAGWMVWSVRRWRQETDSVFIRPEMGPGDFCLRDVFPMLFPLTRLPACVLATVFLFIALPASSDEGIWDMDLGQLLETEVISADEIARQISAAPSAVSIVTADDIRAYGYRSLSDILNSMRGLSMAHDWSYGYLSGRGYGNPGGWGGYAGRIMLLIDGYRAPENYWGQSFFGTEAFLDVSLIERVEYIPGSGSSSYGDAAFLGVINVITKNGRDIGGVQLATSFASHGERQNRVSLGHRFENGLDVLFSTSGMRSRGRLIPGEVSGIGDVLVEINRNQRFFLKASFDGWMLETAHVERGQAVRSDRASDNNSFARLRYDGELRTDLKVSFDFYYGRYRYTENASGGTFAAAGNWRGIDAKLVSHRFDRHMIVVGAEYRDDFKQSYDGSFGRDITTRQTSSLYFYDDISITDRLSLNLGGRLDARAGRDHTVSPRAAIVYVPIDGTVLKLSSGKAHRQMNADQELLWVPNTMVEKLATRELVWEQMLGKKTRLLGSIYSYQIENYLEGLSAVFDGDGNFIGTSGVYGGISTKGFELELEHLWDNGVRLRTSYAQQDARDSNGLALANVPRHVAKLNLSLPLIRDYLRAGIGVRHQGKRLNLSGEHEPAVTVADLTLSAKWRDWSAAVSVRNLGNVAWNEVSGAYGLAGVYPSDRRNWWVQLEYTFK